MADGLWTRCAMDTGLADLGKLGRAQGIPIHEVQKSCFEVENVFGAGIY